MKHHPKRKYYRQRESGAVLIIGLIMVLLISIIALSAIRSSNLQEAMAGNMRDRNIAFQAAESALVVGESQVHVYSAGIVCTGQSTCHLRNAQPFQPPEQSVIYLSDDDFENLARASELELEGVEEAPVYMIEELSLFTPNDGGPLEKGSGITNLVPYRITAKGKGLGAETTAIVQSIYNRFAFSE
jgi:type IV pilus assembly protein PilX